MKKLVVLSLGALLFLSSCGTYTETGATTGGWFGSIIGSAIGGIAGGPRGSDIGTLVGMAGGAVVGAAIGQAAEDAHQKKMEEYHQKRAERQPLYGYPDSRGYDSKDYDVLEIRRPMLIETNRDEVLCRGEEARVVFEIFNTSSKPVYRIKPSVVEVTGNKHIDVSENVMIESIEPGKGIRYTALVRADNRLKDGEAIFRIGVSQGNREIVSQAREFRIQTSRR